MWQLLNFITWAALQHLLDWSTVHWCIKNENVASCLLCGFCCPRWAEISPVTQHLPVGHQIGLFIIFLISCPYIPERAVSLYGFTWKINNYLQMVMFYNDIYFSQPAWQKLFLLTEIIKQTACALKMTLPLALNAQILFFQCSHTAWVFLHLVKMKSI